MEYTYLAIGVAGFGAGMIMSGLLIMYYGSNLARFSQ